MALKGAEQILFLDFVLVILLTSYGVTTSTANLSNIQTIASPVFSKVPTVTACAPNDTGCQVWQGALKLVGGGTNGSIAQATMLIAWAIYNIPVFLIYVVSITITFLAVTESVVFSPQFSANGVPFLGYFFNALQLIVALEVIRIFRGSSSGL